MAEIEATLMPSGQGGDYTSLVTLVAGEGKDFVAAGDTARWTPQGDWSSATDTADVSIDVGIVTSAANNIVIEPDETNKYLGTRDTGKYVLAASGGTGLRIVGHFVDIVGLQVIVTAAGSALRYSASASGSLEGCYLSSVALSGGTTRVVELSSAGMVLVSNTVVDTEIGDCLFNLGTSDDTYLHNVDCVGRGAGTRGFAFATAVQSMINCLAFTDGSSYAGSSAGTITNCAGSDGTTFGTSALTNITDPFVDYTNYNYHIVTADPQGIINGGVDLSAHATLPVTEDFEGDPRSATPTIGADEVIAAPTGEVFTAEAAPSTAAFISGVVASSTISPEAAPALAAFLAAAITSGEISAEAAPALASFLSGALSENILSAEAAPALAAFISASLSDSTLSPEAAPAIAAFISEALSSAEASAEAAPALASFASVVAVGGNNAFPEAAPALASFLSAVLVAGSLSPEAAPAVASLLTEALTSGDISPEASPALASFAAFGAVEGINATLSAEPSPALASLSVDVLLPNLTFGAQAPAALASFGASTQIEAGVLAAPAPAQSALSLSVAIVALIAAVAPGAVSELISGKTLLKGPLLELHSELRHSLSL